MPRRTWSIEQKMAIIMEGLKGVSPVTELCRKHQISEAAYYRWRDTFLEGAKAALAKGKSASDKILQAKLAEYEQIIGQKTVEFEALKKTLIWPK